MTAVATVSMVVGTLTPYAISALGPLLVADLGLSRLQFGGLMTAIFVLAAGLSPAMGWLSDRLPTRLAYAIALASPALAVTGISVASAYPVLLVFAGLGGVGLALANPVSNRIVARGVMVARRGVVTGIKQSGSQLAAVAAGALLPTLGARVGWRVALLTTAVAIAGLYPLSARQLPGTWTDRAGTGDPVATRSDTPLTPFAVYAFLMGGAAAVMISYLPLYANETIGLPVAAAGGLVGVIGLAGVLGRVSVGFIADRVERLTSILTLLALTASMSFGLVLVAELAGPGLLWAGALIFGGSVAWNAVAMIAIVKQGITRNTGEASGRVMLGFYAGFIVAPLIAGALIDFTGSYRLTWLLLMGVTLATTAWSWTWAGRPAAAAV